MCPCLCLFRRSLSRPEITEDERMLKTDVHEKLQILLQITFIYVLRVRPLASSRAYQKFYLDQYQEKEKLLSTNFLSRR